MFHVPLARPARALLGLALSATAVSALAAPAHAADPVGWDISFADNVSNPQVKRPDSVGFYRSGHDGWTGKERPVLHIVRAGSTIAVGDPWYYQAATATLPDLRAGDVAQIVDEKTGVLYTQATFDGLPSIDSTTCAGSTGVTGVHAAGTSVDGIGAYTYSHTDGGSYGGYGYSSNPVGGLVMAVGATTFGGVLKKPLLSGQRVWASSTAQLGPTVTVVTTVERLVGNCPPAQPGVNADKSAPKASLISPKLKTLKQLKLAGLTKGLTFKLTSDEGATVKLTLVLTTKKHGKTKTKTVGSAGGVIPAGKETPFKLKLDKKKKAAVKQAARAKGTKLTVTITLTDAAGNTTTLPPIAFKAPKQ